MFIFPLKVFFFFPLLRIFSYVAACLCQQLSSVQCFIDRLAGRWCLYIFINSLLQSCSYVIPFFPFDFYAPRCVVGIVYTLLYVNPHSHIRGSSHPFCSRRMSTRLHSMSSASIKSVVINYFTATFSFL